MEAVRHEDDSQRSSSSVSEPISSRFCNDNCAFGVSNFAIQYNLSCLAIAIVLISGSFNTENSVSSGRQTMKVASDDGRSQYIEVPDWAHKMLYSAVFAGCVGGMLVMGFLGDVLGRRLGLIITTLVSTCGSLGSAILTFPGHGMWEILVLTRFLLGFGIGGLYPLSASSSAESSTRVGNEKKTSSLGGGEENMTTRREKRKRMASQVAWSFVWQSPGGMAPYCITILISLFDFSPLTNFRIILGLGSCLTMCLLVHFMCKKKNCEPDDDAMGMERAKAMTMTMTHTVPDNHAYTEGKLSADTDAVVGRPDNTVASSTTMDASMDFGPYELNEPQSSGSTRPAQPTRNQHKLLLWQGLKETNNWYVLIGTAGSWFLFDVAFYGTSIFTPFILKSIFEENLAHAVANEQGWEPRYRGLSAAEQGSQVERGTRIQTPWGTMASKSLTPLITLCIRSIVPLLCLCAGTLMSLAVINRWGTKKSNSIGFLTMFIVFIALGTMNGLDAPSHVQFSIFSFLLFTLGFGPNVTTYILPTQTFPPSTRSTFHGISAGFGKLGAIGGGLLYPYFLSYHLTLAHIMFFQAGIAFLGFIVSHVFLPDDSVMQSYENLSEKDSEVQDDVSP